MVAEKQHGHRCPTCNQRRVCVEPLCHGEEKSKCDDCLVMLFVATVDSA